MSEQLMRDNLLVLAQTFATAKGLSLVTVSKKIHGNQRFLAEFIEGKVSTRIETYYQMIDRLRELWPDGLQWPELRDIPSPKRKAETAPLPRDGTGKFLGKNNSGRAARA